MTFSVQIKRSAAKELARIPKQSRTRIVEAIDRLAQWPHTGSPLKGQHRGLRRVRVGSYRVIYEVMDEMLIVLVVRVAHRQDVYRN